MKALRNDSSKLTYKMQVTYIRPGDKTYTKLTTIWFQLIFQKHQSELIHNYYAMRTVYKNTYMKDSQFYRNFSSSSRCRV